MVPPQMRRAAASSRPPFPRRPPARFTRPGSPGPVHPAPFTRLGRRPAPRARPDGRDASYMLSMMALANPLVGTSVAPSV